MILSGNVQSTPAYIRIVLKDREASSIMRAFALQPTELASSVLEELRRVFGHVARSTGCRMGCRWRILCCCKGCQV